MGFADVDVREILAVFDLGPRGQLSAGPVAGGRLASIWRLDTDSASWAVKDFSEADEDELSEILGGAAFQEAALAAGVPTPGVRRTRTGDVIAHLGDVRLRVHEWVDLRPPDLSLDPASLGRLLAGLHRVEFAGTVGTHPWYEVPVGEPRWREIISSLRAGGAPFVGELDALVPELVALEGYLGDPPRDLRTCHRDLWADNVRRTHDGDLCVFDFDNAGLADPSQELALVLVEFGGADPRRARAIRESYADGGGPGRIDGPRTFAMAIAQLAHIVEEGCRRWLAAETEADRADNEGWVREFIDRPLTREMVNRLVPG